ncbi:hypothetical protein BaOVIS_031570 [Babesia ovis]|uniref:Uncharacterized protein n=1 Tax=Babesia ovis TaxID=5869 RepID=A0A9W5WW94_BABOV|nr:hypothetical protein BaOVIS_031570 [Babesia ovis]
MLLAARHLGLPDSAHLWRLTPQRVPGKLPTASNHSRIVYQDGVDAGRGGPQNDIWLGHARFRGYLTIKVDLPSKCDNLHGSQNQRLLEWIDSFCSESARDDITSQMLKDVELESRGIRENVNPVIDATTLDKNVTPHNPASNESQNGSGTFGGNEAVTPWGPDVSITDTTIFVYPYTRGNSQVIVDALHRYRGALEEADLRSLVYLCGSTGSSRALRLLGHILRENCRGRDTPSAIHRVEEHAWPWMKHDSNEEITKFGVPLVLDALSSAAVIQYTFENESAIFDYIASELQKLDSKVKDTEQSPSEELKLLDESILRRALQLLILKRNFSHLNCDHIRVFSDFICDRLHRIDPRSIANLSFALGHSKHLDEFWMFMMAKRIQDNPQEFGPDEIAAIMDAYSNACLEDHEFYSVLCQQISREIDRYGIEHLTVILRSLARVRVRDEWLLNYTLEKLASHLNTLGHQCKSSEKELAYITANCIVAAGDLDYAGDCNFDAMWRLLTSKIKQSSFDICAINWLPLAAMTFASRTTLQTFMPVWLRHVAHTIQKLRSKTFVLTIQRRHHLVRHVFKLGILPRHLLPRNAQRILDDICDCEHVSCP